VLTFKQYQVD